MASQNPSAAPESTTETSRVRPDEQEKVEEAMDTADLSASSDVVSDSEATTESGDETESESEAPSVSVSGTSAASSGVAGSGSAGGGSACGSGGGAPGASGASCGSAGGVGLGLGRPLVPEEEEEEEEEEGPERIDLDEVDAPVAERLRAGLAHLSEVLEEVDALDVAIPLLPGSRGHPAAMRARAEVLAASEGIYEGVGLLWRSLVEAREVANDVQEGIVALRDESLRLGIELIDFQIQAGEWRERALTSEARLRDAELEIASLRARLGEEKEE
ncbi:hypothetical protein CLCR_04284 [Cladophialophora carrionii]|uniref:Uncharacterized protein n=1 Tax=Cladophialophora carrionii TaxID=86049 RepID=A0A1C1CIW2_9EURO|nr:hypothetical protein CLCR_04284 [Cladophialophora carrionii]